MGVFYFLVSSIHFAALTCVVPELPVDACYTVSVCKPRAPAIQHAGKIRGGQAPATQSKGLVRNIQCTWSISS